MGSNDRSFMESNDEPCGVIDLHSRSGSDIGDVCGCALNVAQKLSVAVKINHNGTPLIVFPSDDPNELVRLWRTIYEKSSNVPDSDTTT